MFFPLGVGICMGDDAVEGVLVLLLCVALQIYAAEVREYAHLGGWYRWHILYGVCKLYHFDM